VNPNNLGQSVLARYGDLTMLIVSFGDGDAEFDLKVNGGKVVLDGPGPLSLIDHVVTPVSAVPMPVNGVNGNGHGVLTAPPAPVKSPAPVKPAEPQVLGLHCKQNHFNDPTVAYCSVCGISMTQSTTPPEWGPRPQVGVLVTDDGTTHPLARDLVVGRAPEGDESVAAGTAGTLVLSDPLVSRVHARVTLHDWQVRVTDTGSANGTFLLPHGQASWTRLEPGAETTVTPGSAIAFGHREMRYYSHRNR
jgi:hypothetical protein